MGARPPSGRVLWLVIVAAPIALAFETSLRVYVFPLFLGGDFELVREFLRPLLTPVAWGLAGIAALAGTLGLPLQTRLTARRIERLGATDPDRRYREAFGVFLLTSSVPQVPSILATFSFTFGAELLPVLVAIGVCSIGVVAQALRVPRFGEPPGSMGAPS